MPTHWNVCVVTAMTEAKLMHEYAGHAQSSCSIIMHGSGRKAYCSVLKAMQESLAIECAAVNLESEPSAYADAIRRCA